MNYKNSLPLVALLLAVSLNACMSTTSEQEAAEADSVETEQPASEATDLTQETNFYEILTSHGRMVIHLYDDTPIHRDNFRKLVAEGLYDSTLFHRVINEFMIQGGDPWSKDGDPYNDGSGGPGYTLEAEIHPHLIHKHGALAAARQGDQFNPERRSSGSQFYIVHGKVWTEEELQLTEMRWREFQDPNFSIPAENKAFYQKERGTPTLDGAYTVFGELVEGFDVLDAIATTETTGDRGQPPNRPLSEIRVTIRPLMDYVPEDDELVSRRFDDIPLIGNNS